MAAENAKPQFWTISSLARANGVALSKIDYCLRSRMIPFLLKGGNARIYDDAAAKAVRKALKEISHRKGCSERMHDETDSSLAAHPMTRAADITEL